MIKNYNIVVNGIAYEVQVEELGVGVESTARQQAQETPKPTIKQTVPTKKSTPASGVGSGSVSAPMPGTISDVKVS